MNKFNFHRDFSYKAPNKKIHKGLDEEVIELKHDIDINPDIDYYEVLYYIGATEEEATGNDFTAESFETYEDAEVRYKELVARDDVWGLWVTARDVDGELIEEFWLPANKTKATDEELIEVFVYKNKEGKYLTARDAGPRGLELNESDNIDDAWISDRDYLEMYSDAVEEYDAGFELERAGAISDDESFDEGLWNYKRLSKRFIKKATDAELIEDSLPVTEMSVELLPLVNDKNAVFDKFLNYVVADSPAGIEFFYDANIYSLVVRGMTEESYEMFKRLNMPYLERHIIDQINVETVNIDEAKRILGDSPNARFLKAPEVKAGDEKKKPKKCVICKGDIKGHGHNAEPVKKGKACDKCNTDKVLPARLKAKDEVNVEDLKKQVKELDAKIKVAVKDNDEKEYVKLSNERNKLMREIMKINNAKAKEEKK